MSNNTDIIDWEKLEKQLPPALIPKVLENLLQHHGQTPQQLKTLLNHEDASGLQALAHKVRGATQMIQAAKTQAAAEAVETGIKNTGAIDAALANALIEALDELLWVATDKIAGKT